MVDDHAETAEIATKLPSKIPKWAKTPFEEFLDHQDLLSRTLHMSMNGIAMLRARYTAIKALAGVDERTERLGDDLEKAAQERDLAQGEIDNGFPILHEQATVFLWGSLEALIVNTCAVWLQNRPEAWKAQELRRLKVRLGEYQELDEDDRCCGWWRFWTKRPRDRLKEA